MSKDPKQSGFDFLEAFNGLVKKINQISGIIFSGLKKACSNIISGLKFVFTNVAAIYKKLSINQLVLPDVIIFFSAMFMFSFFIISLETIQYHVLHIVTNYLTSSFVISIAMLGIALGSLVSFYLSRFRYHYVLAVAAVLTFFSVILSYYNIINIGALKYPYLLILPFFFSSIIVSTIFSHTHSNVIYFTNLIASAIGVIIPIVLVPIFNSENSMFILMFVPVVFLFLLSLRVPNILFKIGAICAVGLVFFNLLGFISNNISIPYTIDSYVFEKKIMSEMRPDDAEYYSINYTYNFFNRVYKKNHQGTFYSFVGDEYDQNRARYFLQLLGYYPRAGIGKIPFIEKRTVLSDINSIPSDLYEYEIVPAINKKYNLYFRRNTDKKFLEMVYTKSEDGNVYHLSGDEYDLKRARYLLTELGHLETINLNFDVRYHQSLFNLGKIFALPSRSLVSEDNMLGRLDYRGTYYLHGFDGIDRSKDWYQMALNGSELDIVDCWDGTWHDPRVPWINDANVFIIGLSADGIVKSCKQLKNSTVSGIEIIPTIWSTMQEGQFAEFAIYPYKDVNIHQGEGRSYLQNTDETFDSIYLMNIHAEHSPVCTLGPENLHTVESTKLLLNKLTDRGYVVYEEIISPGRTQAFYMKFLNTLKQAMVEMGIQNPAKHFYIFKWGFFEGTNPFRTIVIKREPFNDEEKKLLDSFFKANVEANTSYDEEMLYSPYEVISGTIETEILTGEILTVDTLPSSIPVSDFKSWVLEKLTNTEDERFIMWAYPYSSGNVLLRKGISKSDTYTVKRILDSVHYPYKLDLSPVYDDKPFPYNVYQEKTEVWEILRAVILLSLIILVPLFFLILHKAGHYKMSLIPPSLFMAVTGFGYMFVEIALMQKFQHFIGAPTFSLIVILGGLLLFSGIGSFVSKFFKKRTIVILTAFIPVILLLMVFYLDDIFVLLSGLSFVSKLIASAILILPLTFLMGIPFPNALEVIKKNISKEYGALMFGVSGAFSTIASTSSILVTSMYGYSATFLSGMIIYFVGLLLFAWILLRKRA